MRILMTTDTVGGVWRFTQELASGLLERGCHVALVSLGPLPRAGQLRWIKETDQSWKRHFEYNHLDVPLEWMQDNGRAFEEPAPYILETLNRFDAELLHANQFCFGALDTNLPKIVTAHSDVLSWAASCRAEPLEECPWLDRYRCLVSTGLLQATVITAPTQWMMDQLSRNFTVPEERHVIHNGRFIPTEVASPRELRAVTAGRLWDPAKNVEALTNIASTIPIFAAGDTPRESATASILGGVHLLGAMDERDLLGFFRESAIYICTSKYEPFGLAPLEAALCGCAVVANDIPSLREVWQDEALYFSDADTLSMLLHRLSESTSLLALWQQKARARARTFTRERMTNAYLRVFEQAACRTTSREVVDVA